MVLLWRTGGRDVRLFAVATLFSFFGDGVRYAALPLLAVRYGAGPDALGGLLAAATVPMLVIGLAGGVLVDRSAPRSVLVWCDAVRLAATAGFALLVLAGSAPLPVLFGFALLMGTCEAVATSATFALVPSLVPAELLVPANTFTTTAMTAGRQLAGPLLGAVLIATGTALPFTVDAATFLVSLALIFGIRHREAASRPVRTARSELAEAARWMRRTPGMVRVALTGCVVNLVHMAALGQLPYYAQLVLRHPETGYAVMMVATAAGGVAAAPVVGRITARLSLFRSVALGLGLVGGGYLLVALVHSAAPAYGGAALTGAGFTVWNVAVVTWRHRVTPPAMRGRADALNRFVSWGALPVGSLAGGFLAAGISLRTPFLVAGVVPLLLAPLFLRRPGERSPSPFESSIPA